MPVAIATFRRYGHRVGQCHGAMALPGPRNNPTHYGPAHPAALGARLEEGQCFPIAGEIRRGHSFFGECQGDRQEVTRLPGTRSLHRRPVAS